MELPPCFSRGSPQHSRGGRKHLWPHPLIVRRPHWDTCPWGQACPSGAPPRLVLPPPPLRATAPPWQPRPLQAVPSKHVQIPPCSLPAEPFLGPQGSQGGPGSGPHRRPHRSPSSPLARAPLCLQGTVPTMQFLTPSASSRGARCAHTVPWNSLQPRAWQPPDDVLPPRHPHPFPCPGPDELCTRRCDTWVKSTPHRD